MVRLNLDDIDKFGLHTVLETVEFVDAEGNVVGTYTPSPEYRAKLYREAWAMISDEELAEMERRAAEESEGGCTTEELLQKLTQL